MKYFQQSVDFDYSWEEVSTSNWQKYGPWNEKTPHVIAVDTLSRTVDPSTGIVSDSLNHMPRRNTKTLPSKPRRVKLLPRPSANITITVAHRTSHHMSTIRAEMGNRHPRGCRYIHGLRDILR
jgi:hypothetical protein